VIHHFLKEMASHHQEWVRIAKNYGAADQAEDVVQDAYIKIYEWASRNNPTELSKGIMFFTVRSCTMDLIRTTQQPEELPENIIDPIDAPKYNDHHIDSLHKAIDSLHWFDAKMLDLYSNLSRKHDHDMSMRQIAKETGISLSTIFTTISKCKEKIRKELSRKV